MVWNMFIESLIHCRIYNVRCLTTLHSTLYNTLHKILHYTTLHYTTHHTVHTTLHNTLHNTLHYITLCTIQYTTQDTTLHNTTLHTTLHNTTLHSPHTKRWRSLSLSPCHQFYGQSWSLTFSVGNYVGWRGNTLSHLYVRTSLLRLFVLAVTIIKSFKQHVLYLYDDIHTVFSHAFTDTCNRHFIFLYFVDDITSRLTAVSLIAWFLCFYIFIPCEWDCKERFGWLAIAVFMTLSSQANNHVENTMYQTICNLDKMVYV